MYFTVDDYRKIEDWLSKRTIKDTDFKEADPISNKDLVTIVQDGLNKKTTVYEVAKYIKGLGSDFLNLSSLNKKCYTLQEAINCVPSNYRKLGLIITFHDSNEGWLIYQFKGHSCNLWNNTSSWTNVIQGLFENLVYYPDEEDITYVTIDEKKYIKLSDKAYNKDIFSGKGRVILRKNLKGIPSCAEDDEDQYINVLKASDFEYADTVFIVQYDFDLQGKSITLHEGCSLWFQGGTINNGTIVLEGTSIIGVNSEDEIGNGITISGNYAKGQILRRTINNREVYAWFDDTEWIPFLDNIDLKDINSHIKHLEDNHLKDVNGINETITKHLTESNNKYNELNTVLNNLKAEVQNNKNAIETNKGAIANNSTVSSRAEETANSVSSSIETITQKLNTAESAINDLRDTVSSIEIPDTKSINTAITNIDNSIKDIQGKLYTEKQVKDIIVEVLKNTVENHYITVSIRKEGGTFSNVTNVFVFATYERPIIENLDKYTPMSKYSEIVDNFDCFIYEQLIFNGTLECNTSNGNKNLIELGKGFVLYGLDSNQNFNILGSSSKLQRRDYDFELTN